jgi:hypothetical protein
MKFDLNGGGKKLCNSCTSILADGNLVNSWDRYIHPGHDRLHLLEARAEAGCLICGIALRELSKRLGNSVLSGDAVVFHALTFRYENPLVRKDHRENLPRVYVLYYAFSHGDVSCTFDIYVVPSQREYHLEVHQFQVYWAYILFSESNLA